MYVYDSHKPRLLQYPTRVCIFDFKYTRYYVDKLYAIWLAQGSKPLPLLHDENEEQHRAVHERDEQQDDGVQREVNPVNTEVLGAAASVWHGFEWRTMKLTCRTSFPESAHSPCAISELG